MGKKTLIILIIILSLSIVGYYFVQWKKKKQPLPDFNSVADPAPLPTVVYNNPVLTPPASTGLPMGVFPLSKGSRGKAVQMLQVLVGLKPDGVWGTDTDTIIRSKLKVSSVDFTTFIRLVSANAGTPNFPLKKGSTGNYVKALQILYNLKIDGIFGANTERAVISHLGKNTVTQIDFQSIVTSMLK